MRYAKLLTIAVLAMGYVSSSPGQTVYRLGALPPGIDRSGGPDLHTAEVDLFKKRTPAPAPEPDDPTTAAVIKAYPILAKTDAVVAVFGAEWCTACKRQVLELKGPSLRYNVLVFDVEKEGEELAELLKIGRAIPVIMVLEKGKPTKTFIGYTPWAEIKPHAGKAAKDDSDQKGHIDIGPIHIDWDTNGYDSDQYRRNRH